MSLYERHYVSNTSEQARLKEQQKNIFKALQDLSVTARIQQQQESDKMLARQHMTTSQLHAKTPLALDAWYNSTNYLEVATECRPYSPYTETYMPSNIINYHQYRKSSIPSSASSTTCSLLQRQRTPSMTSITSSSFTIESEKESCRPVSTVSIKRDKYGFRKPTQWVKVNQLQEFEIKYQSVLRKQTKSWNRLFLNNDQQWPELCPELAKFVRKGIPQDIRFKAWMNYSGAENKLKENMGVYQSLVEQAETLGKSNEYADAIRRDLHRTFPDNSFFACDVEGKDGFMESKPENNEKLQMLHRVLLAFSVYSPDIGYCQSLNFLAGFLLIFGKEEEAFWMLVTIIRDYFPKSMFDTTMEGANIEQVVLMMMVYEKMPGVWTKIANKKCFWECEQEDSLPPVTLVTSHWFLTLFINILPVETVLRIWDCFFVGEGFKVLYQVALTILKLNEQMIWDVSDSVDTFQILQNMPRRLIDCHEFMKSVFSPNGIAFDMTIQEIDSKRDLFRNRKRQRNLVNTSQQ